MINGYITYNELKIITGYSDVILSRLIKQGLNCHELELVSGAYKKVAVPIQQQLFKLNEVEDWLKIHIY